MSTQRPTGMHQRAGSTNWHQRIMIPTWARTLYEGKAFMRISLHTSDAIEARRKSLALQSEWADRFESQRHLVAPPTVAGLTPDMVAYLCSAVRHSILDADDRVRFAPKAVMLLLAAYEGVVPPIRYLSTELPVYLRESSPDGLTVDFHAEVTHCHR